jgi:hypothetical protein
MATPGLGKHIVFGVWAASDDDLYAVGSAQGRNGFVWHYDGEQWSDVALPSDLPLDEQRDIPGFFKVWGASSEDVWVVGDRGVVLRGNVREGFRSVASGSSDRLFTVHGAGDRVAIVGGSGAGAAFELSDDALVSATPPGANLLQGVCVSDRGEVWTVGAGGNVFTQQLASSEWLAVPLETPVQSLHAVWVDPNGGVWAVGGNVLTNDLDGGIALYRQLDARVSSTRISPPTAPAVPTCPEAAIDPEPEASIARRWNEQLLNAVRRDIPRPTVHARNLFHTSIAMWYAWAAYDDRAAAYLVSERHAVAEVTEGGNQARRTAVCPCRQKPKRQNNPIHRGGKPETGSGLKRPRGGQRSGEWDDLAAGDEAGCWCPPERLPRPSVTRCWSTIGQGPRTGARLGKSRVSDRSSTTPRWST